MIRNYQNRSESSQRRSQTIAKQLDNLESIGNNLKLEERLTDTVGIHISLSRSSLLPIVNLKVSDRFPIDSDDGRDVIAVSVTLGYSSLQRELSRLTLS